MTKIQRFEELRVWQMARRPANLIYDLTDEGEFARDFKLRDQIRDAASSVMHNIAEGFDDSSDGEFIHFIKYSRRSAGEVQSQPIWPWIEAISQRSNFSRLTIAVRRRRRRSTHSLPTSAALVSNRLNNHTSFSTTLFALSPPTSRPPDYLDHLDPPDHLPISTISTISTI